MNSKIFRLFAKAILLSMLVFATPGCGEKAGVKDEAAPQGNSEAAQGPANRREASESVQEGVDSLSQNEANEKRKEIMQEAIAAIQETRNALAALDSNNTKGALNSLERATGKLELILARDPNLALAPMDMSVSSYDVLTTLEDIKKLNKEIKRLIDAGEMQEARRIIANLRSEIVLSIVNIPLATYPQAIKAVSPLIDEGKIQEAKTALANALSTLVVADHIIPLPVVRAEEMLKKAEALAEKIDRDVVGNDSLSTLLKNARYQLQMAAALGYGERKDYNAFYSQLDEIEKKTEKGKSGKGLFDDIKGSISALRRKIFK
ncbi:MAG: YfdX family protein [Candidatus Latescibacteria bacterium]|nr:YfdX family protein [Candidatus Latescibacterota bacterium]